MSPVLQFGPADGLRMPFGTQGAATAAAIVINGKGERLGTIHPFSAAYRGEVVMAAGLGASQAYQTMVAGTGQRYSKVRSPD